MSTDSRRGALLGLLAALSFGISAPLAKLLLADTSAPAPGSSSTESRGLRRARLR